MLIRPLSWPASLQAIQFQAVVLDVEGLSTQDMQAMARWTNPSETTFVAAESRRGELSGARIFTPRQVELPSCWTSQHRHRPRGAGGGYRHAECAQGGLVQECAASAAAADRYVRQSTAVVCADSIGAASVAGRVLAATSTALGADITPVECVNVGPTWIVAGLTRGGARLAARSVLAGCAQPRHRGRGHQRVRARCQWRSGSGRLPVPADRIPEDPVCSGNGDCGLSAGEWRVAKSELLQQSGAEIYGDGTGVSAPRRGKIVWIGGHATTGIHGALNR